MESAASGVVFILGQNTKAMVTFLEETFFAITWKNVLAIDQSQWQPGWSLGINIFCQVSLLRLRFLQSRSRHSYSDIFSLGLVIETCIFSVSVLVSSLRLKSRSRHLDSDYSKYCQIIEQMLYIILSVIKDMDNWPNIV